MTISALVYAIGGAGKSHIGPGTSPGPVLVVDMEGGAHKLRGTGRPVISWDYKSGVYPEDAKPENIYYCSVESVREMDAVIEALHTEQSPFVSFWTDSYTVYVKMADHEVIGQGPAAKDQRQDYKRLLHVLEPQVISLNHIRTRADRKLEVVGYTAWQHTEKMVPALTGSISQLLDHSCDLVGQVAITFDSGKLGQVMHIMPTRGYYAKAPGAFYMKYGEQITNPNFTQLNEEMNNVI